MKGNDRVGLGVTGEPRSYGATALEVTSQALLESQDALRVSEERLRVAQQVARIGTFEWNIQTGVNVWTPELEAMYGLVSGEFGHTQRSWEQLLHAEDRASAVAAVQRALDTGEPVESEWRVVWPDGSVRWLFGRFRLLRDAAGKPHRLIGVNFDITERKRFEQTVLDLNEDLERVVRQRTEQLSIANRELETFAYSVAHDLRAPLRGMHGFAKILSDEYGEVLNDDARDCLRRIQSNAVSMSHLIDGLLALARVIHFDMNPDSVDLSAIARSVAVEQALQEPERDVRIEVQPGLRARVDRTLARALMDSLLSNAWKFTSRVPCARVAVGAVERDGEQVFYVRDNGAGFDMQYTNKLFVPFQRLHAPREFPGTGIGLAACHRIVARHGGRIWAESKVGEGATVFFTLPGGDDPFQSNLASETQY